MDNFLHLSDEGKDRNEKTNLSTTHVNRERIERLKKSFLPSWMRWLGEQKENSNQTSSKNGRRSASVEPN
jgi:hypothetical protein